MSNSVQLSLLQLVRAMESTSSELPIRELIVDVVSSREETNHSTAGGQPSQDGDCFELILTVFENMLLELSIEPIAGPPHGELNIRLVSDPSSGSFSGPQMEWIPRLLDTLCEHSLADESCIALSSSVQGRHRELVGRWKEMIANQQVDSQSIVSELNKGPFRSSALDHGIIEQARDLCMRSIVLQSYRPSANGGHKYENQGQHDRSLVTAITPTSTPIDSHAQRERTSMSGHPNYHLSYGSVRGSSGLFDPPPPISREDFAELQKHVVNLNGGHYSQDGEFSTSSADVRAMLRDHIPNWAVDHANGGPLRIVLYAHGGLTNEAWGLHTAAKQMKWWKANGVYPIFFVWETGLGETLWQMFSDATRELGFDGSRGLFDDIGAGIADRWDRVRDRMWETTVRGLGIGRIWGRMKDSAAQTFAVGGDGREVLDELKRLCDSQPSTVKLHAVGHSAGSIFLAHAINTARKRRVPSFKSVHLLAPAITNQLFEERFLQGSSLPSNVKRLSVFTMNDALELDDKVFRYQKSLLYLIYYALEPERETDILGLERSLRNDSLTERLFGLNGHAGDNRADIVFSKTRATSGLSASQSTTHGGFDDDPATMESVLRRIKRVSDTATITPFPTDESRGGDPFSRSWDFRDLGSPSLTGGSVAYVSHLQDCGHRSGGDGKRKALCIGINDYRSAPLNGCVADATRWQRWFESNSFSTELLTDRGATHQAITGKMANLIRDSRPGDIIAIQFAGHGTQVPDDNGDERHGDSPGLDEAFVPHDYMTGGLLIDDDIANCCKNIPSGVSVTFFMDCCHSGTNTRFFFSGEPLNQPDAKPRFINATPEMIAAHREARQRLGASRSASPYKNQAEILFSACQSNELAWESNGQGAFTRHALAVLSQHGSLTCREFIDLVAKQFGANRRQTPELWCDRRLEDTTLLASRASGSTGPARPTPAGSGHGDSSSDAHLRSVLREIRRLLDSV